MKGVLDTVIIRDDDPCLFGCDKKFFVYTPEGFSLEEGNRYPVILCFDGQNAFCEYENYRPESKDSTAIDESLERNFLKAVVIGVYDGEGETIRNRQLTMSGRFGKVNDFEGDKSFRKGVLEEFCNFLTTHALPYFKEKYNLTLTNNVISVGASSGGLASLYISLKYPELFCSSVALSPATCLFSIDDWKRFLKGLKPNENQKYYLYNGKDTEDELESYLYDADGDDKYLSANKIKNLLTYFGIPAENVQEEFKDKAMHNEKFWALYLSENLSMILKHFNKAESKTEKVGL